MGKRKKSTKVFRAEKNSLKSYVGCFWRKQTNKQTLGLAEAGSLSSTGWEGSSLPGQGLTL